MLWIWVIALIIILASWSKLPGRARVVIVLCSIGISVLTLYRHYETQYLPGRVEMAVRYDPATCSNAFPLRISIDNKSGRRVKEVKWSIAVLKPGYLINIAKVGAGSDYQWAAIIKPGETTWTCSALPILQEPVENPSQLTYKISYKKVLLEKD
ncbi:MAG TPA: hypothetical protein VKF36_14275 [Syntrophorhabdales bacterium]|nr:hypothetical protein [Syntrophorhabdales bacterium]